MPTPPERNAEQAEALDRLTRLQALTASLSEAVTSEQVADAILAQAAAVLGARAGVVARLSDDGRELVSLHATGYPAETVRAFRRFPADARLPLADAVRDRQPVLLAGLAERDARYPEIGRLTGVRAEGAVAALPLVVRGKSVGGIGLRFPAERAFAEQDRAFLLTIAGLCAQALERARLYDTERAARERAERAEAALRESEERLRAIIDNCPSAIFVKDPGGHYLLANRACEAYSGEAAERAVGKTAHDYFARGLAEHLGTDDRKVLQTGEALRYEAVMPARGETLTALTVKFPLRDAAGRPYAVCGIATDITELKRAGEALRESEERFRATFEQAAVGIAHVGLDGRWLRVNRKLCDIVGYRPEELLGLTFQDITHPDDVEADLAQVRRLTAGEIDTYSLEKRYVRKDRSPVWINLTVSLVRGPEGQPKYFISVVEDVTERKEVRDALRESEGRLRTLSNNLPHGAIYQVLADPGGGRRFQYISAGVERLFGVTPAEAMADAAALYGLVHEEDRPRLAALEEVALRESAPFDCEFRLRTRAGGLVWAHARSAPRALPTGQAVWEGILMDVTARKRAEGALDRERELLGTIFDRIPVMLTVYEPDTRVLRLNPAFERATGWSARDAAGVSLMEECYPDPAYRGRVADFMRSCRDGWMDIRMRTRDGRDLETSWANVRLADGTQVGIGLDITDRKRYEQSLRDADRRKDEFLATLAHELRNPLAPIRNGLHLLRLAGDDRATAEQARAMMERQLAQMVRLIDDLLDVSRITRGKLELRKERVSLASVVQSAVEGSRPLIEASAHRLTVALPPEPVYLDADPTRLAQVLANLLTNAAKYTDRGGRIWLTARRDGGEVIVSVRDTGIGLAAEHLPRLFEMFSQVTPALERSQGGLGIGLSLVKGLVEMHGGAVEARSGGPGQGSEFIVRLPAAADAPGRESPRPGGGKAPAPARRRILVADDNRDAADSLAMMLRLGGHEVHAVHDGQEAVDAAGWFRPDVALLDIGMPKLNGFEAARRIREGPGGRRVVLVATTGWGQEEDKRRAAEAGFDEHLTKPVEPAALEKLLAGLGKPG